MNGPVDGLRCPTRRGRARGASGRWLEDHRTAGGARGGSFDVCRARPNLGRALRDLLSAATRLHKSAITTAGDHDISCRNQNENIPSGLCELGKTQSRGAVVRFGSPPHRHRQRRPDMRLVRREQASTAPRSWQSHERNLVVFFGPSDLESRAVTSKAEPLDPLNAECTGVNWTCIGSYNHLTFTANMRAVVFVFIDLSWCRGLCAKKSRRGTAIDKKNDRRSTKEGARRGRAGATCGVAAVRAL